MKKYEDTDAEEFGPITKSNDKYGFSQNGDEEGWAGWYNVFDTKGTRVCFLPCYQVIGSFKKVHSRKPRAE